MRTLDGLHPEQAEDALVRLAGHVPPDVAIGKPVVALRDEEDRSCIRIMTDTSSWWIYRNRVARIVELPGLRAELVEWRDGRELSRTLADVE